MTLRPVLFALFVALLVQNAAELAAGGPGLPAVLDPLLPARRQPAVAVALVTALAAALILPAVLHPSRLRLAAAAMAAGGLALNALAQIGASLLAGRLIPGTLAGAALMLPAALASLARIGPPSLLPALVGALASPMALLACWHLAARLP